MFSGWFCYWFMDSSTYMSRMRVAWKIFKLKCVRVVLSPLIKAHVWFILRAQKKAKDDIINQGTAKPKQGQEEEEC